MYHEIIQKNRAYLHSIENWIAREDYDNSRDHYGCPPHVLPLLNLPIDHQPTYTDLLVYAARRLHVPVRYLELGVRWVKTFTSSLTCCVAILVGFDWERFNPRLERRFSFIKADSQLRRSRSETNRVAYLQGDIATADDWAPLQGLRFNLILSDACHRPDMLRREFAMWQRYDLIDAARFVIVRDDLDREESGPLTLAYREIAGTLCARYGLVAEACFRLQLNGWLGQHEHKHTVGVVNSIGLTGTSFQ